MFDTIVKCRDLGWRVRWINAHKWLNIPAFSCVRGNLSICDFAPGPFQFFPFFEENFPNIILSVKDEGIWEEKKQQSLGGRRYFLWQLRIISYYYQRKDFRLGFPEYITCYRKDRDPNVIFESLKILILNGKRRLGNGAIQDISFWMRIQQRASYALIGAC